MSAFNERIRHFAEPAWREYHSARAYMEVLRAEGFEVEEGSGGTPTAFVARWGSGGPVLASFSECDAVPGNCQAVVPRREPRAGMHPCAAGHTDPHSWLGTAALTAVLAAKAMALTLLDLLAKPGLLDTAQADWRERSGGGMGGSKWVAPLLPKDFAAPVDLKWLECVTTARGDQWCVPRPADGLRAGERL